VRSPVVEWSSSQPDDSSRALGPVLRRAQRLGFIGPASIPVAIEHARGFAAGFEFPPGRLVDLGAGGGLPGLVLADLWRDSAVILVEARHRRCEFLREAVDILHMTGRVTIVEERAEVVGRWPDMRGRCDAVVARGFGPPAVTAECAAPLLRPGGSLVVSEPPPDETDGETGSAGPEASSSPSARWPPAGLAILGMVPGSVWADQFHYRSLVQAEICPERYPRRVGAPAKRPLF
jgi:16S rRNA (guanine527-N7)-methyltransferase